MPAPSAEFIALQRAVAGRFSLVRELGRGGMGVVFLARDVALDRLVALKLLPPALAARGELRQRFLREARTAAGLAHPHIVAIYTVEERDGLVFFVMGFVDGETLGERVRRAGPLTAADAMRVTQEVAWALAHSHARGVVHRDVKPDNVLLERGTERALVADFGIATLGPATVDEAGGAAGTPQYTSPEQARDGAPDARSDVYSLGVTAWFALTGRLPFEGGAAAQLTQHASAPVPSLASALAHPERVPPRFVRAVERCLAKSPADRFPDAESLAAEVEVARLGTVAAPPSVRAFVRNAEAAGGEMGTALIASVLSVIALWSLFGGDLFAGLVFYTASALTAGLAGARFGQVVLNARRLLADGFGFQTVRSEILREEAARAEAEGRRLRRLRLATWVLLGWGAVKTSGMVFLATWDGSMLLSILGAAGAVIVPTFAIRMLWDDLRGVSSFWNALLAGRLGRFVFGTAGIWLRKRRPALPDESEPTVVALGDAAGALFASLSAAERAQLPEVPRLIARLRDHALALRERDDAISQERLAAVAAALETIRLDLLRLSAGDATALDITTDLQRAAKIGERVDAALGEEPRVTVPPVHPETTPA